MAALARWAAYAAVVLGACGVQAGEAPRAPQTVAPPPMPVFTEAQVSQGRADYARWCAVCHGAELQGAAAVALSGANFQRTWGDGQHKLRDLYDITATQMPKNAAGSLSPEQNFAIVAYMLARNGHAAGSVRLGPTNLDVTIAATGTGSGAATGEGNGGGVFYPQRPATVEEASGSVPTDADILHIDAGNWLTYNRTLSGDRFSPLTQINTANAHGLKVLCRVPLGESGSFETSPLVYRGLMYLTTVHKVFAVDGSNCAVRWSYTYVPVDAEHLPNNRGVALYDGKVFRGTIDGHLLALDAQSGKLLWDVRVADARLGYEITGAPVAFAGKVFVGDAGADVGINGRIYAFDVNTGAVIWTFDMVPTGNQAGAETWGGGAEHGGGATWSSMAIDPHQRLLFVPTGNPAPDFNDKARPGANLYTDAVVALKLDTGKLAWYVQQVPHDIHDWDTAAAPALFDRGGRHYMSVASKNGLLFTYDRDSHAVVSATPFTTRENVDAPLVLGQRVHVCPGALGQYNGPGYDPKLDLLFLGAADRCNDIRMDEPKYIAGSVYFGGAFILDPPEKNSGWIRAFRAADGSELWRVHRRDMVLAAVTPTAGGVLLTGDSGGEFLVLKSKTGEVLFHFATGGPVAAGITTYLAGGKQFIAVPSGSSSRDNATAGSTASLVVFALAK